MRKAFVGVTDFDWYEFLAHRADVTEINFWQPSASTPFRALDRGDLFLFKLHSPNNFIVGGGFFEVSSVLPVSLAWETFGVGNGAPSLSVMRERIAKYRREAVSPAADYTIGNIILQQPFFFQREAWIPVPGDFSLNIVRGKGYDLDVGSGRELWNALEERMAASAMVSQGAVAEGTVTRMFSDPVLARRRLGQGGFRVLVTDNYARQCAVTSEHTLPVLEAAHIKPVTQGGEHTVSNGLLLRSDVHTLFDRGYVTVTPDFRFRVSRRLDEDWQNGKVYYRQENQLINLPSNPACRPDRQFLEWHADTVFLK
jgi:putative restriction endonuclease